MADDDFKEAWDVLASPAIKQLVVKLRYMGNQYAAGQAARGGGQQKHYLQEAADELERLFAESVSRGQEVADLRNVVQVACIDGMPGLTRAWAKYFLRAGGDAAHGPMSGPHPCTDGAMSAPAPVALSQGPQRTGTPTDLPDWPTKRAPGS